MSYEYSAPNARRGLIHAAEIGNILVERITSQDNQPALRLTPLSSPLQKDALFASQWLNRSRNGHAAQIKAKYDGANNSLPAPHTDDYVAYVKNLYARANLKTDAKQKTSDDTQLVILNDAGSAFAQLSEIAQKSEAAANKTPLTPDSDNPLYNELMELFERNPISVSKTNNHFIIQFSRNLEHKGTAHLNRQLIKISDESNSVINDDLDIDGVVAVTTDEGKSSISAEELNEYITNLAKSLGVSVKHAPNQLFISIKQDANLDEVLDYAIKLSSFRSQGETISRP